MGFYELVLFTTVFDLILPRHDPRICRAALAALLAAFAIFCVLFPDTMAVVLTLLAAVVPV
jgi:hypothetical protein